MLYYLKHRTLLIGGCRSDEVSMLIFCLGVETMCKWTILLEFRSNVLSSSSGLETVRWKYFRVRCRWTLRSMEGAWKVSYWGPRTGAPGIVRKWAYKGRGSVDSNLTL